METKNTISWDEISDLVEELLEEIGWSDDMKILWAEKSWIGIENNGLADYRNELERCKVYIRLISMVVLYGEFCSITTEETFSTDFHSWMDRIELSPIRIGQLVGSSFDLEEYDEYDLIDSAIAELVDQTTKDVMRSISKEFGGINKLFVGLWLTYENLEEYFDEEDDEESQSTVDDLIGYEALIINKADFVLNHEISFSKTETYEWLTSL
ncbi:hypothetical protein [Psychrobacillus sp. FSL K6-1267]|uniref:hypothetical protein n=1 Tax=Psychrobacillus sp. FSL K6-1267 TaxID=2921543 RepID=UPI0030FC4013